MPTTPPPEISTADLQKYIPNAQKPIVKSISKCSLQERKNIITQSQWNVYNSYQGDVAAYKDLAMQAIESLQIYHRQAIERLKEGNDPDDVLDVWISDARDLDIAFCLLRQIDLGSLEPLFA